MQGQLEIAYVGLESPEPAAVARYLTDVVGLMPGPPLPDGSATWRDDAKAHRLWLKQGPRKDAVCIGFEARDAAAWQQAVERLQAIGLPVAQGTPQELAARRVHALARVRAPWGVDGLDDRLRNYVSRSEVQDDAASR